MKLRLQLPLLVLLTIAALMLFWKVDTRGINEWDEARNGVNAYEMCQNKDMVNLYYAGALDTWNAKPPLMIWLIAAGYKLFGPGPFALRLPSILAMLGFFIYTWKLVRLFEKEAVPVFTCLILLSCKAMLGVHTGLTGDFDALLVFLLTTSAYYFIRYIDYHDQPAIYLVGILTGIAFYAKGPAAFIYIPSFVLYGCARKRGLWWLSSYRIWAAAGIAAVLVCSWVLLVIYYGKSSAITHYGSSNAIVTMLKYDTWNRLTTAGFEGGQDRNYAFFFSAIDVRFNLWNYMFYLALGVGAYTMWRTRKQSSPLLKAEQSIIVFSACAMLPITLLLTFARYKYDWYLAPAYLFIAIVIAKLMWQYWQWQAFRIAMGALLLFTLARQCLYVNDMTRTSGAAIASQNVLFKGRGPIVYSPPIRQDIFLQLTWLGRKMRPIDPLVVESCPGCMDVIDTASITPAWSDATRHMKYIDGYAIGVVN